MYASIQEEFLHQIVLSCVSAWQRFLKSCYLFVVCMFVFVSVRCRFKGNIEETLLGFSEHKRHHLGLNCVKQNFI